MYLHLGGQTVVPESSVLGIFDLDRGSTSKRTRDFLTAAERAGQVRTVGSELPVSFVVCHGDGQCRVYLSPIASRTLARRAEERTFDDV